MRNVNHASGTATAATVVQIRDSDFDGKRWRKKKERVEGGTLVFRRSVQLLTIYLHDGTTVWAEPMIQLNPSLAPSALGSKLHTVCEAKNENFQRRNDGDVEA